MKKAVSILTAVLMLFAVAVIPAVSAETEVYGELMVITPEI